MNPLPLSAIAEYAKGSLATGDPNVLISRISTDSRTIEAGDLFVPIRGENFDGHRFLAETAERGAVGALVEESWRGLAPDGFALIRVADTLAAYQEIAASYRKSLPLSVIGITGSNGKTSTKDFVAAALGKRFQVTKTEGNCNNHVGLPQTILEANRAHEIGVWELGMNHPGEIAPLARIAVPDAAIITNIGIAHVEFMGSRERIAQEKGALVEAISSGGTVVLNADDPFSELIARRTRAKVIFAGIEKGTLRAEDIRQSAEGSEFTVLEGAHRCRAQLPVAGLHMVQNAILAIAAARAFGVSLEECAAGLASTPLTKARLQLREIRGVRFLDDSYNANPESMKAALRTLLELETDGERIAVLGQMGELGVESERAHIEVGQAAAALRIDRLITIGDTAAGIGRAAQSAGLEQATNLATAIEAADLLAQVTSPGDLVLVKGSRFARTERVLEEFERRMPAEVRS
ncbi:MAG: UDP-N-acetylmuramoyl-tripeptide--D-alanyl-D-alanine ligase [Verrucomicrobiota bacterium]|nr:UDP-N-acetylmuramoyl-tripeptide--D-alanyl-D-alanine ligase [Verrucomicrobiota bacterium]